MEHPWFNALHNTAFSKFPWTKYALEHKGKAKNKIIPQAFHQASAFMAKSKGHVSPPASERGNYPFPVREQQMIANYGGAFSGAEICQLEGEGGLIFWQLYIYFYHCFFHCSFVVCFSICCMFFYSHELAWRAVVLLFLCLWASEGVFMCPTLTYLFIVLHFLTVIFFFPCCDHFTDYILSK